MQTRTRAKGLNCNVLKYSSSKNITNRNVFQWEGFITWQQSNYYLVKLLNSSFLNSLLNNFWFILRNNNVKQVYLNVNFLTGCYFAMLVISHLLLQDSKSANQELRILQRKNVELSSLVRKLDEKNQQLATRTAELVCFILYLSIIFVQSCVKNLLSRAVSEE